MHETFPSELSLARRESNERTSPSEPRATTRSQTQLNYGHVVGVSKFARSRCFGAAPTCPILCYIQLHRQHLLRGENAAISIHLASITHHLELSSDKIVCSFFVGGEEVRVELVCPCAVHLVQRTQQNPEAERATSR
jgi:hypothetical protein